MKLLFAVSSCKRDSLNGANQACRDTWIPTMKAAGHDYRFFIGNGDGELQDDEVRLDVPDSYIGPPWKARESLRWALDPKVTRTSSEPLPTHISALHYSTRLLVNLGEDWIMQERYLHIPILMDGSMPSVVEVIGPADKQWSISSKRICLNQLTVSGRPSLKMSGWE